jgi:hypothetical protein
MMKFLKTGNINHQNESGQTVLHAAAAVERGPNIIKILLDAKANINAQCYGGKTALHYAFTNPSTLMVVPLLQAKADPLIADYSSNGGQTPRQFLECFLSEQPNHPQKAKFLSAISALKHHEELQRGAQAAGQKQGAEEQKAEGPA